MKKIKYPTVNYLEANALNLDDFRDMDYYAVNNYKLPIELMMENASLQLDNLVAGFAEKEQSIKIGIGNGNNGGGGLVLLNNNELGKISKEQRAGELDVWATDMANPNFAEYANGCGALGIKVTNKSQLRKAIVQLLEYDGPGLVEIKTDVGLI